MEEKKKQVLQIQPSFSFVFLSDEEINHIRIDNDLIKGFHANYKRYNELKSLINPSNITNFFDICHILGYFKKGGLELEFTDCMIEELYSTCTEDEIDYFLSNINEIIYSQKSANVLLEAINNNSFKDNLLFYANIYNHFKMFSKQIEKINKNRMRTITIKGNTSQLKEIKDRGKSILPEDVDDYKKKIELIMAYPFLRKYYKIFLLETFDSEELKNIIEFYMYALENTDDDELYFENINLTFDDEQTIRWIPSKDPLNLVLGYILKVCSTFQGTGSKIMIDGILNSNVKHIVIEDKDKNVIGKTTAVYYEDYIFINALNFTDKVYETLTHEEEKEYYYKYLCVLKAQYDSLLNRGYKIEKIRVATDPYILTNSLRDKSNKREFDELLSKCSFYWEEFDDKLFDHQEPKYKLVRGLK